MISKLLKKFTEDSDLELGNRAIECSIESNTKKLINDLLVNPGKTFETHDDDEDKDEEDSMTSFTLLRLDGNYSTLHVSCPGTDNESESTTSDEEYTSHPTISTLRKELNKEKKKTLPRILSGVDTNVNNKKLLEETDEELFLEDDELWRKEDNDKEKVQYEFNQENKLSILNILKVRNQLS